MQDNPILIPIELTHPCPAMTVLMRPQGFVELRRLRLPKQRYR